mmetsp:Transcript_25687/g.84571  ORF Transcript_25687/g.84571 Transcript_25687/m.84571 type:complete len:203 (+) Transcript_25687:733-1341(+)
MSGSGSCGYTASTDDTGEAERSKTPLAVVRTPGMPTAARKSRWRAVKTRLPGTGSKSSSARRSRSRSAVLADSSFFASWSAAMPPRERPSTLTDRRCRHASEDEASASSRATTASHCGASPNAKSAPGRPATTPQPSNPILRWLASPAATCGSVTSSASQSANSSPICVTTGRIGLAVPSKNTVMVVVPSCAPEVDIGILHT